MRGFLATLSVLAFLGGTGYVARSALSFKKNAFLTPEMAGSFNAMTVAPAPMMAARPLAMPAASPMPLRDAVASPVFVSAAAMLPASTPKPSRFPTPRKPAAGYDVNRNKMFASLLAGPARYMASKTLLGKPAHFQAFMNSSARVNNYTSHPLIRSFLDNKTLLKSFVGQPAVTQAFLKSPAMQDPKIVEALFKSKLFAELLKTPGAQALIADPAFLQQILMNPQTVAWLSANPAAMKGLAQAAPQLQKSLAALAR